MGSESLPTRSKGWSVVRWSEFVILVASAVVSALDVFFQLNLPLSPGIAAGLAILSKTLRALLQMYGRPSSSMSPSSWIVAYVLALITIFFTYMYSYHPTSSNSSVVESVTEIYQ